MRLYWFFSGIFCISMLQAEIREITQIEELFAEVRSDSILLMDLDETLIESSIMLGGKAWRTYAFDLLKIAYPQETAQSLMSGITHWIAKRVPCIPVESVAVSRLEELKARGIPVFGFTARGKNHWRSMVCPEGADMALLHLKQAGFDLEVAETFSSHPSFFQGIFFARHPLDDKGKLAFEIFAENRPSHVLFIDDDKKSIFSMDDAFKALDVPAICFHYQQVNLYRSFDPLIAAIQLEKLYLKHVVVSDAEAALLKPCYADQSPDALLLETIEYILQVQ